MRSLLLALALWISQGASAGVEEMQLQDLEGMLPSSWLDRTGFRVAGDTPPAGFENIDRSPLVPLLPVYQSGSLRNTYVGGVVESKYLAGLDRRKMDGLVRHIRSLRSKEGHGFQPHYFDGKLYAIRDDFNVSYQNSTTVGFSLSFGGRSNTVILGKTKTLGFALDLSAPIHLGRQTGLNAGASFQNLVNEWTTNFRPDDTQLIVDQAVSVTPYLLSYFTDPAARLLDEAGRPLSPMAARRNDKSVPQEMAHELVLPTKYTSEWGKVQKELRKNVAREAQWRKDIAQQVANEVIVDLPQANGLIQELCDRIATVYQTPQELWPKCHIGASLVPNAWAYPGGDIFISAGLLGILTEVDSVALILGHEIGHVMGRHTTKRTRSTTTLNYAATYVSTAASLGLTALSLGGGFGLLGDVTFLSWFPQTMAVSTGGSYLVNKSLQLAFFAPVVGLMMQSRGHESQSDRIGQEAAFIAGMDLEKMNQGWDEFMGFFEKNFPKKAGFKERLLRSHPGGETRLRAFQQKVQKMNALHGTFNAQNVVNPELREEYRALHALLKPLTDAYGRSLREQYDAQQASAVDTPKKAKLRHFVHTMLGSQTQCVRHALGAE
jgi:Zn-dependent protease with chaperone function